MKKNYLLALSSAFLLWLSWPPIPFSSILLLIAFVPLLFAVEDVIRSDVKKKGNKVFLLAFITGTAWNTASIYWVYNAMNAQLPAFVSLLISLIPFCLAPLLMGLAFRGYYELRKKYDIKLAFLGLLVFWISYEYLHQWWDLAFPWMTLGNGFATIHQFVQWYAYTGVYGGTLWIWISNFIAFLLFWQIREKVYAYSQLLLAVLFGTIILAPITISLLMYTKYEEHLNPSEVVVVQPNIDPYGKFGPIDPNEQLQILMQLSNTVAKPNTEFFIWPETAISSRQGIDEDRFREYPAFEILYNFLEKYHNGNILSGIESYRLYNDSRTITARPFGDHYIDYFNAGILIDQSSKTQFYHKSKLVPGVEQLPFGSILAFMKPLFEHFGGTTGGYGFQEEPSVFYSRSGIGAAPVICYESIWGDYVAEYVEKGAQFIAIITNDGWWGNTSGKDQHFQYAKLRAIENRRWIARSANTGISGFIDQRGDVIQHTGWWTPAALTQEINLNEELTFYTRHKDLIAYASMILSAFGILLIFIRKK